MKSVKIKAFGITRDILGQREAVVTISGREGTVADLRRELEEKYPRLKGLRSLFIAVNNEYAEDMTVLSDEDEIALIPPVSGG